MDQKTCNSSIHCTVENCAYHAPQNCCSLKSINTGGPPYFPENYLQRRRRAQAEPWPCPVVAFFRTCR